MHECEKEQEEWENMCANCGKKKERKKSKCPDFDRCCNRRCRDNCRKCDCDDDDRFECEDDIDIERCFRGRWRRVRTRHISNCCSSISISTEFVSGGRCRGNSCRD